VFLAQRLAAAGRPLISLYGGRTERDLPLADRLESYGELRVSTEDGSRGQAGLVTTLLEQLLARSERERVVYACGPHGMMAAVASLAARHAVRCVASLEAPMGCGYGVCLGCPVARREG